VTVPLFEVVIVRVEEVPVAGSGLNVPVAPAGRPLTLMSMLDDRFVREIVTA
jgi:hypothetical protein